ncbi:MAG: polysaccharide deacetylase family protein [Butyricicoccaceae bacterium]
MIPKPRSRRTENSRSTAIASRATISQSGSTRKGSVYVSAPALAQIIGRNYTDLGDGAFAFTTLSLDGLDSQKTYLDSLRSSLSDAVDGDIPEADVYIALTFDDGPTGKINYPNGLTNYLLDGLRSAARRRRSLSAATASRSTVRVCRVSSKKGSEIANHTMNHPDSRLTGLSREEVDVQISSTANLSKKRPAVCRRCSARSAAASTIRSRRSPRRRACRSSTGAWTPRTGSTAMPST